MSPKGMKRSFIVKDVVIYETLCEEQIAILRINRKEASNAINTAVIEGLMAGLTKAAADSGIHAVIVTGTGDRSFIAGGDLKEFHTELTNENQVFEKMSQMRTVLEKMVHFPKPLIAAVTGAARGGGGEVAAACHFRIASETASVGFVQVKLGISPGWGGGVLLQRIVGRQKALAMLLSGRIYPARQAEAMGFFDEVVPSDEVVPRSLAFAKEMASSPQSAVQGILELFNQTENLPLKEAMECESRLCAQLWMTPDHLQSVNEFLSRKVKSIL
jgi:enoyl-CoA hydratase/carnithine racemase